MKSIHEVEKNYKCEFCEKSFSLLYNLKNHIKIIHDCNKVENCNICSKLFSTKGTLTTHIKRVHGKNEAIQYFAYLSITILIIKKFKIFRNSFQNCSIYLFSNTNDLFVRSCCLVPSNTSKHKVYQDFTASLCFSLM